MRVKRSKDPVSGAKIKPIVLESWYRDPAFVRITIPNRFAMGRASSSIEITKKEARRLASALLQYTKSME